MIRPEHILLATIGLLLAACSGESGSAPTPTPTPTETEATMDPEPPSMSARAPRAEVSDQTAIAWAQQHKTGMAGGGLRNHNDEGSRRFDEQLDRMSADQTYRLIKGMHNAGMNADPTDPCARVMAMYDFVSRSELTVEADRERVQEQCESAPSQFTGCLKPESERTPLERRQCGRLFRRSDAEDIFGETGPPTRRPAGAIEDGPTGPVRIETP